MAVYDIEIDDCTVDNCGRGYGVLHSNWIGFDNSPKPLFVLDNKGVLVTESNPIHVFSGQ
jgi:hypothetical protein